MMNWDIGVVISLFIAIMGCYVYVHKVQNDTNKAMKEREDCLETEISKLSDKLDGFKEAVIDRLARLETMVREGNTKRGKSQ